MGLYVSLSEIFFYWADLTAYYSGGPNSNFKSLGTGLTTLSAERYETHKPVECKIL